jgi:hypothetical protein
MALDFHKLLFLEANRVLAILAAALPFIHSFIHPSIHPFIHPSIHPSIHDGAVVISPLVSDLHVVVFFRE